MTIKALIYGGHQIIGARPIGSTSYAGVGLQFKGSVIVGGQYKDAYVSIEMSPADAIDIAAMLVKHAEQHGHQTLGIVRAYRGRQAKSAERDKQRGGKLAIRPCLTTSNPGSTRRVLTGEPQKEQAK